MGHFIFPTSVEKCQSKHDHKKIRLCYARHEQKKMQMLQFLIIIIQIDLKNIGKLMMIAKNVDY